MPHVAAFLYITRGCCLSWYACAIDCHVLIRQAISSCVCVCVMIYYSFLQLCTIALLLVSADAATVLPKKWLLLLCCQKVRHSNVWLCLTLLALCTFITFLGFFKTINTLKELTNILRTFRWVTVHIWKSKWKMQMLKCGNCETKMSSSCCHWHDYISDISFVNRDFCF